MKFNLSILLPQVDFANQESQMAFYRSMQASGQDIRDFYDILSERRLVTICSKNIYVYVYLFHVFIVRIFT